MSPARRKPPEDGGGFVDFGETAKVTDPAVSALLNQGQRRQAEAHLPQRERERKRKEREKIRARAPGHTTYDIPPELRTRIKDLAEREGVPASQVATLALLRLIKDLEGGMVDLHPYKTPSQSPRYDYNLDLPEDLLALMARTKAGSGRSKAKSPGSRAKPPTSQVNEPGSKPDAARSRTKGANSEAGNALSRTGGSQRAGKTQAPAGAKQADKPETPALGKGSKQPGRRPAGRGRPDPFQSPDFLKTKGSGWDTGEKEDKGRP